MNRMNRRELFQTAAAGAALLSVPATGLFAQEKKADASGPFSLPKLQYAHDALEPHIDAMTMEIHHTRHHKAFIDNLNKILGGTEWAIKSTEEIVRNYATAPEKIRTAVRNNAGGHLNHVLFWQMLSPKSSKPGGALNDAINATFGDLDGLLKQITDAGMGRFGSGWAWLVSGKGGKLSVISTANQDNPLMPAPAVEGGGIPILGVDVWEHAYYLKYQNKRADYLKAWTKVINWEFATERYEAARKS